ncbi:MAG: phage tail protein [Hyphomicrobium sp.]
MTMLQIGGVAFTVRGPHYESLRHSAQFMWPAQPRVGRRDALQYTGEGEDVIEVAGTIYPDYFGGYGALAKLRAMARRPQMVVSGTGDVFGLYCITEVGDEQTFNDHRGRPGKITFTLKLMRYGEDGGGFGFTLF